MRDIQTRADIEEFITLFYGKVAKDPDLSPFFVNIDWEKHLPQMIHFWCFALLDEAGYTTNVVEKHLHMPLKAAHFSTWLQYFNETIDTLFSGEKADAAKQRAAVIGWTIQSKVEK
jgi:hemoglobin